MSVIKLVSKQEDAFVFDVEALREKLAIYADHKIAVISIAGAFRTGKSFLANWIIRYFELDRDENWLDSQGFTIFGCKNSEQVCFVTFPEDRVYRIARESHLIAKTSWKVS